VRGHAYTPRPAWMMPVQFGDLTLVRRNYIF
jgi:hypothetical protein